MTRCYPCRAATPRGEPWPRRLSGCAGGPGRPHLALQSPLASLLSPAAGDELSTVSHTLCDLHIRGDHRASALVHTAWSQHPCPPLSKGHSCLWTEETAWTQMHRRFVCFPGKGGVSPGSATCWPSQGRSPPITAPPTSTPTPCEGRCAECPLQAQG